MTTDTPAPAALSDTGRALVREILATPTTNPVARVVHLAFAGAADNDGQAVLTVDELTKMTGLLPLAILAVCGFGPGASKPLFTFASISIDYGTESITVTFPIGGE